MRTRGYLNCYNFLDSGEGTCKTREESQDDEIADTPAPKTKPEATAQVHAIRGLSKQLLSVYQDYVETGDLAPNVHWEVEVGRGAHGDPNKRLDLLADHGDTVAIWEVKAFSMAGIRNARTQVDEYLASLNSGKTLGNEVAVLGDELAGWSHTYEVDDVDYVVFQVERGVIVFAPKDDLEKFRDRYLQDDTDRDRQQVAQRIDQVLKPKKRSWWQRGWDIIKMGIPGKGSPVEVPVEPVPVPVP